MKNDKLTQEQREKWLSVLKNEIMSSEESDMDEDGEEIVTVHPLPWRSEYCTRMFGKIDKFVTHHRTPQGRRQMKQRKIGASSTRSPPAEGELPDWSVELN